jgi:peptidoglycan/LPS O-acetylase OafA/YrhL
MLQRIQTLYLFGALALQVICCFVPVAVLTSNGGQVVSFNLLQLSPGQAPMQFLLTSLTGLAAFNNLICIFLYKRRQIQMKQCIINIVMLIALILLMFLQLKRTGMLVTYHVPFVFPLVAVVSTWLAYGRIKKDEDMVKSYDRLR